MFRLLKEPAVTGRTWVVSVVLGSCVRVALAWLLRRGYLDEHGQKTG